MKRLVIPSNPNPNGPVSVTNPASLPTFAAWFASTYELLDRWPACWAQHEGFVHELLALAQWHRAALLSDAAPAEWFQWHDASWRFRDRVLPSFVGCLKQHDERSPLLVDQDRTRFEALHTEGRRHLGENGELFEVLFDDPVEQRL